MIFERGLSKDVLAKAWKESFEKNCKKAFSEMKPQLDSLNALMPNVSEHDHLAFNFMKDSFEVLEFDSSITFTSFYCSDSH